MTISRIFLFLALPILFLTKSALACSAVEGTLVQSLAERAWRSEIVVVGTVTAFSQADWPQDLTVEVESYLRGSGTNTITVTGINAGHSCSDFVNVGDRKLFFLKASADGSGSYGAIYDSAFGSVRQANQESIDLITAALASDSLWAGSKDLGSGWRQTEWFRDVYIPEGEGSWIWHPYHGWLVASGTPDGMWLWDNHLGWMWAAPNTYPYVYSNTRSSWLYFSIPQTTSSNPVEYADTRWVYDTATSQWEEVATATGSQ